MSNKIPLTISRLQLSVNNHSERKTIFYNDLYFYLSCFSFCLTHTHTHAHEGSDNKKKRRERDRVSYIYVYVENKQQKKMFTVCFYITVKYMNK